MDQIYGHVERIVYQDDNSGFTVARLQESKKKGLTCIVGPLPSLQPGETVRCSGVWKNNKDHGWQFEVREYQQEAPATLNGIEKYLASGLIKGIGKTYAGKIVSVFGIDTLTVIDETPNQLLRVPGIGKKRVATITSHWHKQKAIRDVMVFLQSYSISPTFAQKIFKYYGDESISKVRENPYCLARDIHGIGFTSADKIAKHMDIPHDSRYRIEAGIEYILSQLSDDGHVCYPLDQFAAMTGEKLEVPEETVRFQISSLEKDGRVVLNHLLFNCEHTPFIWLKPLHVAETGIASHLKRLSSAPSSLRQVDTERALSWVEKQLSFTLSEQQREAVKASLINKLQIITGGPGTGKSTIISAIISIFQVMKGRILQAAPTGRAAKRMNEITGVAASTIHSLLEFDFSINGFKKNRENPLSCDLLIVDETSMVDTLLMYHLLKALPNSARVLFVGDINQLPSVGPGNVLKDIIQSKSFPVTMLDHIFRQAAGSRIITNAHKINHGVFPEIDKDPNSDFFFLYQDDPTEIPKCIIALAAERIPRSYGFDPFTDIQVISPMKRGVIGIDNLNMELQEALNPSGEGFSRFGRKYLVGDKVMQIRNNYTKEVYNGDIGKITAIDTDDHEVEVLFDSKVVIYDLSDLDELVHAYAVSVHKYQGSECPCVIIPVHTSHYVMLNRNLLYTAVTRGKSLVVLIGTKKALSLALRNANTKERHTGLRHMLIEQQAPLLA